jgi:hypothetical protein
VIEGEASAVVIVASSYDGENRLTAVQLFVEGRPESSDVYGNPDWLFSIVISDYAWVDGEVYVDIDEQNRASVASPSIILAEKYDKDNALIDRIRAKMEGQRWIR